jgi:hypothetical protein
MSSTKSSCPFITWTIATRGLMLAQALTSVEAEERDLGSVDAKVTRDTTAPG